MAKDFKDLLKKIECGDLTPTGFSEDDLKKVKSCLPPLQKPKPDSQPAAVSLEESCLPGALKEADAILSASRDKMKDLVELSAVKGRLDEIRFNLILVDSYLAERLRFYLAVSNAVNPITAETMAVRDKLRATIEPAAKLKLRQEINKLEKNAAGKAKDLIDQYDNIPNQYITVPTAYGPLNTNQINPKYVSYLNDLRGKFGVISGKLIPTSKDNLVTFELRLYELINATIKDGQEDKTIQIRRNRFLKDTTVMNNIGSYLTYIAGSKAQSDSDSASKLYDGAGGYRGLFKTLRAPIQNLFTLDERGLTTKVDEVDPILSGNPDLPKTFKEDDKQFFIKNVAKYQSFYETLGPEIIIRSKKERDEVYPTNIATDVENIKSLARREAAHHLREGNIAQTLSQNTVFDKKTYPATSPSLPKVLQLYQESANLVSSVIDRIDLELQNMDLLIKEAAGDPEELQKKLLQIDCFGGPAAQANAAGGNCEDAIKPKRGTDPFGIRTLTGNDASLPDMTTPCYWKYFAEELTMMGILPIPDLTAPLFRYYPVNGLIPAFPGPIIITLPQKWKVLSVISSPIGTIVPMIALPMSFPSPMPIPLPSIFIFYLAPDGSKYMLFGPNLPSLVLPNQAKLGFEFDSSAQNPAGLSGPYSGLPIKGAFTIPIKLTGAAAKAAKIAKITADLAQGKLPAVTMPNGKIAPGDRGELSVDAARNSILTGDEVALKSIETTPAQDYERLVTKIRTTINKQIDSFDDFATTSVDELKRKIKDSRQTGTDQARLEPDSKKRRDLKTLARKVDPINLETKIRAMIDESNKLIDNLTLGEIIYPDDPSKLNPHLSAAITSVMDLLEMAGRGELKVATDTDLVKKIKRSVKKINPRDLTSKESFNLEKDEDLIEFKNALKNLSKKATDYFKGKKQSVDTSEARNKKEEKEMAEAANEMQDLLVKALSFTAVAFASPPKISVFDPSKPCCESKTDSLFKGVRPEVLAVLAIFTSLSAALIDGLTKEDIKKMLNVSDLKSVSVTAITGMFGTLLGAIPPIPLPASFSPSALIGSILTPILAAISLPELPIPGKPPLPIQIKIPLDAIIKPLLKLALAALIQAIFRLMSDLLNNIGKTGTGKGVNSTIDFDDVIREIDCGAFGIVRLQRIRSNQVEITLPNGKVLKLPLFPDLPLDMLAFFGFMMNTDVISFFKNLINAALDSILEPISQIVIPILNLIPSGSWSSLTPLDLVNPIGAIIKQIKLAIQEAIAKGLKVSNINMDVYPIFLVTALPVFEKLEVALKEIAFMGTAVLCSTGGPGVLVARQFHPIFNQDDLPPWERLTRKNPLFAIFLDEILHRSTHMSLGTLIFKTKFPGMYGVSTVPTLFVPPLRV